jgi:hypothetical protein
MVLLILIVILFGASAVQAEVDLPLGNQNLSEMAIALSEISQGLQTTKTITLLNCDNRKSVAFNEFIMEIHRRQLETCIFNETRDFFRFIEANLKGSLEITALIFHHPELLIQEVQIDIHCQLCKSNLI